MPELAMFTTLLEALFIPIVGMAALMLPKLTQGDQARKHERNFYLFLVVMTAITVRTVILCDKCWLIHTATLGIMIIGALALPSQAGPEHDRYQNAGF